MFDTKLLAVHEIVDQFLHDCDPQGLIKMGAPDDEYHNEVPGVMHALLVAKSLGDLQVRIWHVFCDWFGVEVAGAPAVYGELAERLWDWTAAMRHERAQQRAAFLRAKFVAREARRAVDMTTVGDE